MKQSVSPTFVLRAMNPSLKRKIESEEEFPYLLQQIPVNLRNSLISESSKFDWLIATHGEQVRIIESLKSELNEKNQSSDR